MQNEIRWKSNKADLIVSLVFLEAEVWPHEILCSEVEFFATYIRTILMTNPKWSIRTINMGWYTKTGNDAQHFDNNYKTTVLYFVIDGDL